MDFVKFLLQALNNFGTATFKVNQLPCVKDNRLSSKHASSYLSKLRQKGIVQRVGWGKYQIVSEQSVHDYVERQPKHNQKDNRQHKTQPDKGVDMVTPYPKSRGVFVYTHRAHLSADIWQENKGTLAIKLNDWKRSDSKDGYQAIFTKEIQMQNGLWANYEIKSGPRQAHLTLWINQVYVPLDKIKQIIGQIRSNANESLKILLQDYALRIRKGDLSLSGNDNPDLKMKSHFGLHIPIDTKNELAKWFKCDDAKDLYKIKTRSYWFDKSIMTKHFAGEMESENIDFFDDLQQTINEFHNNKQSYDRINDKLDQLITATTLNANVQAKVVKVMQGQVEHSTGLQEQMGHLIKQNEIIIKTLAKQIEGGNYGQTNN